MMGYCIDMPHERGFLLIGMLVCLILVGCTKQFSSLDGGVDWNLSPEAELSYATLLLDQSIRHDDKTGVLVATDIFVRHKAKVSQPFMDAAAWLMINKQQESAQHLLEKGVEINPDNLDMHLLLAELLLEEQNISQASTLLKNYQKKHPQSELARQEVAILYVKIGHYAEAHRLFSSLPERLHTPFVRYCHSQALLALKHTNEALQQLRFAVKESPEFLDAWLAVAKILESQKKSAESSKIYDKILTQDPSNNDIWLRLVETEIKAGHPAKALERAKEGPDSLSFQMSVATLFLDAKNFKEAEEILLPLSEEPNTIEDVFFYLAALAYEAHQDREKTFEYLGKITQGNRFYDRALRLRAQILQEDGKTEEALELIHEGQKMFPENPDFWLLEGHFLISADQKKEALTAVGNAQKNLPDNEDLMFLHASILDLLGQKVQALDEMESLLKKSADNYQALNYIGYTLADQNRNIDRALLLLRKAARLAPDHAYILDSLAWAQYRKGLLTEALGTIRKAVTLPDGEEWAIWDHYGDIAAARGQHKEALRAWKKALTLDPDNPQTIQEKLKK